MKNKSLIFLLFISISACNFSNTQDIARPTLPVPTPSPFITFTPSPIPTIPTVSGPVDTDRACTTEDFKSSSNFPDPSHPESLIGFQPGINWLPSDWESMIGIYNPEFDYSIHGIERSNQYIFLLEKPICRYGKNNNTLSEIRNYLLIPALDKSEIIISSPALEQCCLFQPNISERFDFKWERFAISECSESLPRAILLARYDPAQLPQKIRPGTRLPVKIIKGWQPATDA